MMLGLRENGKIVATVEARMTSSRLPGKVLLPAGNKPMLEHLINRLKKVRSLNEIVLATTSNSTDDVLEQFAKNVGIAFYRGSEDDVMQRVIESAESVNADIVVEITGDCPIIDPLIIEQCIQTFLYNKCDYVSNVIHRSYPDGMDVQVFRLESLKKSALMTTDDLDHEHVSLHIRNHPGIFKQINLMPTPDLYWPELGLTLDEKNDYILLKNIIEYFGETNPFFSCRECIELLKAKPELVEINKNVKRKGNR